MRNRSNGKMFKNDNYIKANYFLGHQSFQPEVYNIIDKVI